MGAACLPAPRTLGQRAGDGEGLQASGLAGLGGRLQSQAVAGVSSQGPRAGQCLPIHPQPCPPTALHTDRGWSQSHLPGRWNTPHIEYFGYIELNKM